MHGQIHDEWKNYEYEEEEGPVFILYNHGIYTAVGRIPLGKLLSIAIFFKDRFPSGHEFPVLREIETLCVNHLELLGGVYAGRATFKGKRVFYFYLDQEINEIASLIKRISEEYPYPIEYLIQDDPEKSLYIDFLLPREEYREDMSDREIIWTMIENGDALDIPRRIDYWVLFKSLNDLQKFTTWAKYHHFKIESFKRRLQEEEYPFELVIYNQEIPTFGYISQIRELLKKAVATYNGVFEGWETQVVHGS